MDLQISQQHFLVCGASGGFGKAIAETLLQEGAQVTAVARSADKLQALQTAYPKQVKTVVADVTTEASLQTITTAIQQPLHGILLNAGGPPAMSALEATLPDWDNAYASVLRWKIALLKALLPAMQAQQYGRIVSIESVSVKQPVENLVLSNAIRMAVVGYLKTLSQEVAGQGITINIMAPGYHATDAMNRLIDKKAAVAGISREDAAAAMAQQVPVGRLGTATEFASLAAWLFSPHSGFVTGQTFAIEGGLYKGSM